LREDAETLDIGCGDRPKGDVNVDLNRQRAPNFVLASCEFLPFRDKAFRSATCYHVLEHLENPVLTVREVRRVSEAADFRVPYRNFSWCKQGTISPVPGRDWKFDGHKCSFTLDWFKRLFKDEVITDLDIQPTFRYGPFLLEIIARVKWWRKPL
jgi:hypothetical protein